jgi:hypothetical protein
MEAERGGGMLHPIAIDRLQWRGLEKR